MTPLAYAFPRNEGFTARLIQAWPAQRGGLSLHRFPDGETRVRLEPLPAGSDVALVCTLDNPDAKVLPLLFAAGAARELGARSVGLVAPYLAYMRQDRRFNPGEALTAAHLARLVSGHFDWLVTVDPHLHRYRALADVYSIPATAVSAAAPVAAWIRGNVRAPLLVGPDAESAQWVAAVAALAKAPHVVLEKVRNGDRDVAVSVPDVERWRDRTPVLVDDIISSGRTMIATVRHLVAAGLPAPVCIGTHAIFAARAYEDLGATGAARIVTANTIAHPSNDIDVAPLVAAAVATLAGTDRSPD